MMSRFLLSTCLALLLFGLSAPVAAQDASPWDALASAHGVANWSQVRKLSFTWKHKNGKTRSYDWDVRAHTVGVTVGGERTVVRTNGKGLQTQAQIDAHKMFINDSYWLLFEFHAIWDDVKREDLGQAASPFGGKARALRVVYPAGVGYTPGDAYVLFIGEDGLVMGWSYFPGGADKPRVTSLRGGYRQVGALKLPTRFETPDGELLIEIRDLSVE